MAPSSEKAEAGGHEEFFVEGAGVIGAKLGHFLDGPLYPVAKKISISPNALSVAGFLITSLAAVALTRDLRAGGILIGVGGLFDMLDGIVARTNGKASTFGAFLDSVLDRVSDAFLFFALAWHFGSSGRTEGVFLSLGAMLGAFVISYARARAEGLGKDCTTGLMERPERIILLIAAALTGWLIPALWIMLVLTYITVFQRIYHVWRATKA